MDWVSTRRDIQKWGMKMIFVERRGGRNVRCYLDTSDKLAGYYFPVYKAAISRGRRYTRNSKRYRAPGLNIGRPEVKFVLRLKPRQRFFLPSSARASPPRLSGIWMIVGQFSISSFHNRYQPINHANESRSHFVPRRLRARWSTSDRDGVSCGSVPM